MRAWREGHDGFGSMGAQDGIVIEKWVLILSAVVAMIAVWFTVENADLSLNSFSNRVIGSVTLHGLDASLRNVLHVKTLLIAVLTFLGSVATLVVFRAACKSLYPPLRLHMETASISTISSVVWGQA